MSKASGAAGAAGAGGARLGDRGVGARGSSAGRETGTVKFYKEEKGFGFMGRHGTGQDIFFHIKELRKGKDWPLFVPEVGMELEYSVGLGNGGRPAAKDIIRSEGKRPRGEPPAPQNSEHHHMATRVQDRRFQGTVSSLQDAYGFVKIDDLNFKPFFWRKNVDSSDPLHVGAKVDFMVEFKETIGPCAFDIFPYFIRGEVITRRDQGSKMYEQRDVEFKSLAESQAPERAIGAICNKYVCAMLNTRGGDLIFGVADDGTVQGVLMSRYQRDTACRDIDYQLQNFNPSVDPSRYRVTFCKVMDKAFGELKEVKNRYVVKVHVIKGDIDYYTNRSEVAYIRRDGSVMKMTPQMLRRRITSDMGEEQLREEIRRLRLQVSRKHKGQKHNAAHAARVAGAADAKTQVEMNPHEDLVARLQETGIERPAILEAIRQIKAAGGELSTDTVLDKLR